MAGYAFVFAMAAVSRILLSFLPVAWVSEGQRTVWSWPVFGAFVGGFALAVALADRARLPTPAETLASPRRGIAVPAAVGGSIGLLIIISDLVSPVAAARGTATIHVGGWAAIPFYAYGALLITTLLHFLPIAAAAAIARHLRPVPSRALVVLAVIAVALSEDLRYFLESDRTFDMEWARHTLSVIANGTEALFIYRLGLLAGVAQRSATYLLWHLAWPLVQTVARGA